MLFYYLHCLPVPRLQQRSTPDWTWKLGYTETQMLIHTALHSFLCRCSTLQLKTAALHVYVCLCVCVQLCVSPSQHVQYPIKAQNPIYILLLPWPGG